MTSTSENATRDGWTRADGDPPGGSRLELIVVGDGVAAKHVLADAGSVTIGRSRSCDVRIDLESISRHHATLEIGPTITIRDEGSANGTRVRGEPLARGESASLRPGDVIELGTADTATLIVQQRAIGGGSRGLRTHDYFESRLEDECDRTRREEVDLAVIRLRLIDAPASAGADVLVLDLVRGGDVVARYGPDDIEILLPETNAAATQQVARRLYERLAAVVGEVRMGVACRPRDGRTAAELLESVASQVAPSPVDERLALGVGVMQRLHRMIERIARGEINVLLLGETGVGKELVAEQIHTLSDRAGNNLLRLNCAAFSENLLESELFGYEQGAFTGAERSKPGLLETAVGGTVFLDEIGDVPLPLQAKLLRVIEDRTVMRVGGLEARPIDVRFIAATHRDIEAEIRRHRFREDLYFRLDGVTLVIPPLRQRVDEIEPLALGFVEQAAQRAGTKRPELSRAALDTLRRYAWPGNVRELRNFIERAVLLAAGDRIDPEHLPLERMRSAIAPAALPPAVPEDPGRGAESEAPQPAGLRDLRDGRDSAERKIIVDALERAGGNQTRAAQLIGISRSTLIKRLDRYGIHRPRKPT